MRGGSLAEEGLTWARARTFYREHELFTVDLPDPAASPLPPFVNISQARTEAVLDKLIADSPLVEVRWGHEVEGIEQGPDGITLLASTSHGQERVAGRYAVACAGARGRTVRRQLGVGFPGRTYDDVFLVVDVRTELPAWSRERRFYFDPPWNPGRQVLIHPCPGSVFRIDWQVDHDVDLEAERHDGTLHRRISQVIGGRPYELVWASLYRFHARTATRLRVERAFLAGDLAHLVSPFGARGLNAGVADVDNLAWKLAAVLRGWAPDRLLDSYETERLAAARENLAVTTSTMDFLVPRSTADTARRRRVLEQSVSDPDVRELVDSGRLYESFWYVDSPLTTPDPARPWPGRPVRGRSPAPVPGVVVPDAAVGGWCAGRPAGAPARRRLRELVRGRLSVVTDDAERADVALAALRETLPGDTPLVALDLSRLEGAGPVLEGLSWEQGDLWLVRPDGHTSARVRRVGALVAAATRALALHGPAPPGREGGTGRETTRQP